MCHISDPIDRALLDDWQRDFPVTGRPFQVLAEKLELSEGDVIDRTTFVTKIRTTKNVEVTITNAMVMANHIVNYSGQTEEPYLILNTTVTQSIEAMSYGKTEINADWVEYVKAYKTREFAHALEQSVEQLGVERVGGWRQRHGERRRRR